MIPNDQPCICFDLVITTYSSPFRAEQNDIEVYDKIMQLHPDFRAFMRGLSQDNETEGFSRFLGLYFSGSIHICANFSLDGYSNAGGLS